MYNENVTVTEKHYKKVLIRERSLDLLVWHKNTGTEYIKEMHVRENLKVNVGKR